MTLSYDHLISFNAMFTFPLVALQSMFLLTHLLHGLLRSIDIAFTLGL